MSHRLRRVLLVLLLLGCYAYVLPRWSDWSQNSRLDLVLALGDHGSVIIDRYVANTGDYALFNGHAYSDKAPGTAFLALPPYLLIRPLLDFPPVKTLIGRVGQHPSMAATLRADGSGLQDEKVRFALVQYLLTLLTVALPSALFGLVLLHALMRLGLAPTAAMLCTLGYGLGTTAAVYAGNFYSHQQTAILLFGAFWLAWLSGPARSWARGLLCGLLLGWAVISEYPAALPALGIGIYSLLRHRRHWLAPLAVGAAVPGALLIWYDLVAFGTILPIGYAHSALWQDQHHTGFMSLTYPRVEALWGLTMGPFRGLFVRAPWLLLALPGYIGWWRSGKSRAEWWLALFIPLSTCLFYSSSGMWWGGFASGPRYLVMMLPFLTLAASWWVGATWAQRGWRFATSLLVASSVALVWAEALAGQLFPPDSIRQTWSSYVLPAWADGDLARNVGMALGLGGAQSILPLAVLATLLVGALLIPLRAQQEDSTSEARGRPFANLSPDQRP